MDLEEIDVDEWKRFVTVRYDRETAAWTLLRESDAQLTKPWNDEPEGLHRPWSSM